MANLKIDDLAAAVVDILDKYEVTTEHALKDATDETVKDIVRQLRAKSPKNTGKYAKSWTQTETPWRKGAGYNRIAYVKAPYYRLTHILEYGYPLKTGGRYPAQPHIKAAEQDGIEEFERKLREKL